MKSLAELYPRGVQLRGDVLVTESAGSMIFSHKKRISIRIESHEERAELKELRTGLRAVETLTVRLQKIIFLLHTYECLRPYTQSENTALDRQLDWLSHFAADAEKTQRDLAGKKILLLGCGGTGGVIAEHLVRAGVTRLVLVDGATVDLPDMNRQLTYVPRDCGQPKVASLGLRLSAVNPEIEVVLVNKFIASGDALCAILCQTQPDLVINCADTPVGLIHSWVSTACSLTHTPVLFGGVGLREGTLGPLLLDAPAKTKYAQIMLQAHEALKDNQNILKASLAFTNTMMAALIAFEAFKFLSGSIPATVFNKALSVDLFCLSTRVQWQA